ncbi:MAG TPA: hypothetical protein VG847_08795 [Chitinophagaceae bacterium]|nr:hypothetical protein [Chitinophagaceae bacterium]
MHGYRAPPLTSAYDLKTLFPPYYNWGIYLLVGLIIRLVFFHISWASYIAIMISIYQFSLLFGSLDHIIPTRYLLGTFMCIQFFVGPTLAYNGLDPYAYFMYRMKIPEENYFAYAIPAVCLFILGTHINAGKYKGEVVDTKRIAIFVDRNPRLPYMFIIFGLLASVISARLSSELAFVFYLLGSLKFIGLFMLLLGTKRLKIIPLIIVTLSIVSSSLNSGMFHDLITWSVYAASIFAIKYKFGFNVKMMGLAAAVFVVTTIQVLKGNFRTQQATNKSIDSGADLFAEVYQQKSKSGGLFNLNDLAQSNVRINQGFIITNIMHNVPEVVPFQNGAEMYKILEAAILPRILAPNKLNAGDQKIFMKYSGIGLAPGTSMGLSSLGDAYINWGVLGGCIFMFFLGLFYCVILNTFQKYSADYPALILFTALVFYYPIRPDCELQTILGHVFKSLFFIWVIFQTWKYTFYVPRRAKLKTNLVSSQIPGNQTIPV